MSNVETKRILLVDDARISLLLSETFLTRKSFEIFTAGGGREALSLIATHQPDLVIVDLYMPDMDGDLVCRQLKQDPVTAAIPVIILTASGDTETEQRCLEAGCSAFVVKPVKKETLLQAVERTLQIAQRKHVRAQVELECQVQLNQETCVSRILSLSQKGAFIATETPLQPGEESEIYFSLPGGRPAIATTVSVKWIGRMTSSGPLGMGVEFTAVDHRERVSIQDYVEDLLEEGSELQVRGGDLPGRELR